MTQPVNPLFPNADNQSQDTGYILLRQEKKVEPATKQDGVTGVNEAISVIREKLTRIYADAPDPLAEEKQAEATRHRSKHQQYMYDLQASGKSLAEIQTAWHNYYVALPDNEKHQVWQEFYEANDQTKQRQHSSPFEHTQQTHIQPATLSQAYRQPVQPAPQPNVVAATFDQAAQVDPRTPAQLRHSIRDTVTAGGKLRVHHHLQSLGFGLAIGVVTVVITLFGFFNEVIIAPFIQPGNTASATPIIIDPSAVTTSTAPEVIIPKINLEIPVDFSQTSNDENTIQNALEKGIVHYPSTVMPGQTGNGAYFGHSSNNIFNPGKYKFAFVLLHELVPGDTFYITYNGKAYIYKVFDRKVVDPSDVGVLDNIPGHTATATLITCDPPGTALHRLVVVGDQISPDPSTNSGGTNTIATTVSQPVALPDNGPSLLQRIWDSVF